MAQKQNGAHPSRTLHLTGSHTITIRPVQWLWTDRIALGTLCLIGGRENIGKSLVTYTLAAQFTRGLLPGAYFGTPRSVVIAAYEDSWEHTIVPRLMAAGADLTRVHRLNVTTPDGNATSLLLPLDLVELRRVLMAEQVGLLVLDPLLSRLHADLDSHKDADVRVALEPLVAVADATGAAVLGIIHVNKSTSDDPLTLLMGSRAFAAVARSVLFVMVDPHHPQTRLLGQAKNNLGHMDLPTLSFSIHPAKVAEEPDIWTGAVTWLGEATHTIHEAIAAGAGDKYDQADTAAAAEWLIDYLEAAGGPCDSAKIKKSGQTAGHSARTLARARDTVGIHVVAVGFPRRTLWTLPSRATEFGTTAENTEIF